MKFETRRIGETDIEVTTLGLGTATLGGLPNPVSSEAARELIAAALAAGINYIDTAPFYGMGKSERRVGDGIREYPERTILSTKVGRLLSPQDSSNPIPSKWAEPLPFIDVFDYSYDGIMRSFEDSQQRLGLNKIDILYVHDIGIETHGPDKNRECVSQLTTGGGYKALRELRDNGTVSAIGAGVNEWEILIDLLDVGDWDTFLLAGRYTLLEQTSLSPLMAQCVARKTSIVIGGPFNSGLLVGGNTWNYETAPKELVDKVNVLKSVCADFNVALPAAALQFPLAHPAVINVIPGPRNLAELTQILEWWHTDIPNELWDSLIEKNLLAPGTPLPGGKTA